MITSVSLTALQAWDSLTSLTMSAPTKSNREYELAKLLEGRFEPYELMAIARELDAALYNALYGRDIGLSQLAAELVRTAFKHGLIGDEFFTILHRERPRLRQCIDEVAALWHEERKRQPARDPAPAEPVEMVEIPAGSFIMGSPDSDEMALDREKPVHLVHVSTFRCMTTLVTRAQWAKVVGQGHEPYPEVPDNDRPATNISWFDAVKFCNKLSKQAGLERCYRIDREQVEWVSSAGYRLPTEAEWEYACRAGTTTRWWYGNEESELEHYAWYDKNSGNEPQPVGGKPANPWGLYDMHGNVWEWCWDIYASYPSGEQMNPQMPSDTECILDDAMNARKRLLRGGSYGYGAEGLRCASRGWDSPSCRSKFSGMRVVCGAGRQP